MTRPLLALCLVAALLVGTGVPAGAVSATPGGDRPVAPGAVDRGSVVADVAATNDSSVNVTVGQQLSTVLSVTSDDVQTDVEDAAFELATENESDRVEAIAERAEELRDRAVEIREDYRAATEAYDGGDISRSEYAQRLATLNARATNVLESYETLQSRVENVSALDLRAAGLDESNLTAAMRSLDNVTGTGAAALLQRYTGESEGEVELRTDDGLEISVENEDGDRSREFDRPGDGNATLAVSQSTALETARDALSPAENDSWVLTGASIDREDGEYEFDFRLRSESREGDADVTVDGSSGDVTSLEEEVERDDGEGSEAKEADDDESRDGESEDDESGDDESGDDESDDGELAVVVAEGPVEPDSSVTLLVRSADGPAENATVSMNGEEVATTGDDGQVTVDLPASGEVTVSATAGDAEGELEFELGGEDDDELDGLSVGGSLSEDELSVVVTFEDDGVANATVFVDDERVGTTGDDGTATFAVDVSDSDRLDLTVVKGEFEVERTVTISNGSVLAVTTSDDDDDRGEAEGDEEDEEAETVEEDEGDEKQVETDESDETDETDESDEKQVETDETDETDGSDEEEQTSGSIHVELSSGA